MDKSLTIAYKEFEHYAELDQNIQNLIEKAYEICEKAYAPYSGFKVGTVLELQDGKLIFGNNQENMAYPSGLCAERVALFHCGANYPEKIILRIVIVAKGDLIQADDCLSPCGSYRQVIAETEMRQKSPIQIILVSQSGRTFIFDKISDLLIFPFGL